MGNHDILFPALQKYYSALKSLNDFGCCGNFFDDVSRLDNFFSEFRNITFVIQKGLCTVENKTIYENLRNELLTSDTLKWFVSTRNKTTKETPFPLKKRLIIDVYLSEGIYRLRNDNLTVDFDKTFDDALIMVKNALNCDFPEIHFSSKICFNEDGSDIDLYPKIILGISEMHIFLKRLKEAFPCDCCHCQELEQLVASLYRDVISNEIYFVNDYDLEVNKELVVGEKTGLYFATEKSDFVEISDVRANLDNPIFGDINGCIIALFERFILLHIKIFQMQNHKIMPVFMIIFTDSTYKMIPFVFTTKSAFYREVNEIINNIKFDEVSAVLYCGEYYFYGDQQLSELKDKTYSDRIELAQNERLCFSLLLKGNVEWFISFDESKIEDQQYVMKQIKEMKEIDSANQNWVNWLTPIKEKLNS